MHQKAPKSLKASKFIKKKLQHRGFTVNIAKSFKNTYFEKYLNGC